MKPHKAENYDPTKLRYPFCMLPKLDGVRALNPYGTLIARSMKFHRNAYTTKFWSRDGCLGIDGELVLTELGPKHPDLCRLTSSAVSTGAGEPNTTWWAFDHIPEDRSLGFLDRYHILQDKVAKLQATEVGQRIQIVPMVIVHSFEEFEHYHNQWVEPDENGEYYEGSIIRDLNAPYKYGRSTLKEMGFLRRKDFVEEEMLVTGITEGETNMNEQTTNALGYATRSSHKAGKVPNGQVGSIQGKILKDSKLFKKDDDITIATGCMTESDCIYYFQNQHELIGKTIKFKFFPKGIKDKPRFGQFQSIRSPEDMDD